MLSLEELRRAARLLDAQLRGHRVHAIAQPDATSIVFSTWGGGSVEQPGARSATMPWQITKDPENRPILTRTSGWHPTPNYLPESVAHWCHPKNPAS